MIDYKLLNALAMVVREGGFERAAKVLLLTQSAVSQRVRQLEDQCGQLLLTRTTPPQPTEAGKVFLKHYQQVHMLESALQQELTGAAGANGAPQQLAIGINADSLDYWFLDALAPLLREENILLDLRVDDQEQTQRYLRDGDVVGCISTEARALPGCRVEALGDMHYQLLASAEFIAQWFPDGLTVDAIRQAPAVLFSRDDGLHQRFIETYVTAQVLPFPTHYIPAANQFQQAIVAGYCYGMIPEWQGRELLNRGILQELIPGAKVAIKLYWHRWNIAASSLERLSACLLAGAEKYLL